MKKNLAVLVSSEKLIPYRKAYKWGFCNERKKIIIECNYIINLVSEHTFFEDGTEEVELDGKFGRISRDGDIVVKFEYNRTYKFSDEVFQVIKEGKRGLVDKEGKIILNCLFEDLNKINDNLIIVKKDGKDRIANLEERKFHDFKKDELKFNPGCNLLETKLNDKYGLIYLIAGDESTCCCSLLLFLSFTK